MTKTYKCSFCNYDTIIHCNYEKHLLSAKHKKNYELSSSKNDKNKSKNDKKSSQNDKIKCEYCDKLTFKSNIARHLKTCKVKHDSDIKKEIEKKKQTEIKSIEQQLKKENDAKLLEQIEKLQKEAEVKQQETEILRKKYDELNDRLIKHLEDYKDTIQNRIIINNIQNNTKFDIDYIDKHCLEANDYKLIMEKDLTEAELEDLKNSSHIEGPVKLMYDRCIKDIPLVKRSIHLLDESRKKYYIYYDGSWQIDQNGKIITDTIVSTAQPAYMNNIDEVPIDIVLKNHEKFQRLYNERLKILAELNDELLLKNNINKIKAGIKLLAIE